MNGIEDEFEREVIIIKDGKVCIDAHRARSFVYRHPEFFGLEHMDDDERYDFVFSLSPAFTNIETVYRISLCPPLLFLSYFIRLHKNNRKIMQSVKPQGEYERYEVTETKELVENVGDGPIWFETLNIKRTPLLWLPRTVVVASLLSILILTKGKVRKSALSSLKESVALYKKPLKGDK